jgi:hypothetical protein
MTPNRELQLHLNDSGGEFRLEVYTKLNLMELTIAFLGTAAENHRFMGEYTPSDVIAMMALFNTKKLGDGYTSKDKDMARQMGEQ